MADSALSSNTKFITIDPLIKELEASFVTILSREKRTRKPLHVEKRSRNSNTLVYFLKLYHFVMIGRISSFYVMVLNLIR